MMVSNRPYLLRAFYQWIVDSHCTPILVIDANHPKCKVPKNYAEGDEIVFNISSNAIRDLKMLNDVIEFKASFSGIIHIISAPIKAVLAIYAEENGEGIFFDARDENDFGSLAPLMSIKGDLPEVIKPENAVAEKAKQAKPFLKLVE